MEQEIESKNAQSESSASIESKELYDNVNKNALSSKPEAWIASSIEENKFPRVRLASTEPSNSSLYFRSLLQKSQNKTNSYENTYDCVHSKKIFATNFKSQNTTQTTQPILNSTEKTNINNKNDNNIFLNSNYLSKSLSTDSTSFKTNHKGIDSSNLQNRKRKKAAQPSSQSRISTWLHYPNNSYNRQVNLGLFTNECSCNQTKAYSAFDMILSNPSNQINQQEESENRRQAAQPPSDQTSKTSNENISTAQLLAVSSASSTASSSSSPPTFIQNTRISESTTSSLASSISPQQNSKQVTPTHPLAQVDRFRIKKTLETDLINSATIVSVPDNSGLNNVKEDELGEVLGLNETDNSSKLDESCNQKNTERRISKFTVKKVDTTDLLTANKNDNLSLVDDAKKIQHINSSAIMGTDPKINQNLTITQFQESVLLATKQEEKNGENKFCESISATRSNSIIERSMLLSSKGLLLKSI